jgi:antitoxin HicB
VITYPVVIEPDGDDRLVTFPDVPEAITAGRDDAEALRNAHAALATAVRIHLDEGRPLPSPSPAAGRPTVSLSALVMAKLQLGSAMRRTGIGRADLARRLGASPAQVDKLLDLRQPTGLDLVERAMAAVGKRLVVAVEDAA